MVRNRFMSNTIIETTYRTEIHNFGTPFAMLPLLNALSTVVCIRNANISTHDATILVAAIVAFVAYANQGMGIHKGVTNHAFSIA